MPSVNLPGWEMRSLCSPQRWAISSSASANCPLCSWEREGILSPGVSPKSSRCSCLARGRVPHHFGWVLTGVTAPSLAPRFQGWGSRGPKSALAGDTQGAGTSGWGQGGISPPSRSQGAPLPSCPLAPPSPPPCTCLCAGAGGRQWGGGNTGWSESEPGICRMSPYPDSLCFPVSISTVLLQPPAGGWQGASLGGGDLATPLTPCSLPFLPCCPRDARAWAINRGRCSSSLGARGDPGARSFVTPHRTVCFHRASVSPPRCSCGAGGMLGLVPPQPRR